MAQRTVYVDGSYVAEQDAKVSVFDRGFLFADGVYEVCSVLESKVVDFDGHMRRLRRSTAELDMGLPWTDEALLEIHRELIRRNDLTEGLVYLQLTRGNPGDRDFDFPAADTGPTLVLFTQTKSLLESRTGRDGIRVATQPDWRWMRRDIKTVQLLYPSMAKMAAKAAGADDAWMVEDGLVTEGASNNAWMLSHDGVLVTRELSSAILPGITRAAVMAIAEVLSLRVEERAFSVEEAKQAKECFVTSATSFVTPVIALDGVPIGDGMPGEVAMKLRAAYIEESRRRAI
ncbi:D-amino-acid transaminase [Salinicola rhizosphaerae]|uniref:branched-chain-amino-acid transaminase n=1 Tax=Salinicola rhizosphaerae TaxID=1443141 RepID=A0ABQ3DPV5_9GAMM|nr:D-amino-acid transaminase [Salinicola rhizosphaerae]GHB11109.1 D-alanine aminotransferase [Salinicola rhizosphaerae]